MFKKILIANRGEIAVRIIRACRELKISTVAVYADVDKDSLHVKLADEAVCIGNHNLQTSYLNIPAIIQAAENTQAEAIHPGFGFLSENSEFARQCESANIKFIGPSHDVIALMGDKNSARSTMKKLGVPIVEGSNGIVDTYEDAFTWAEKIGYPVMIKATAGGGGKGMRVCHDKRYLEEAFNQARSEAKSAFGNDGVYLERFIMKPRHIEVQILGDGKGNVVHLFDRECSIQRKNQKIIEEAPVLNIPEKKRKQLWNSCVKAAKALKYESVGTFEFMMDENHHFYFIEMNTRIQVEHTITETITGVDLVRNQIYVAAGNELELRQKDIKASGYAIELRVNAEDPSDAFAPSTGTIQRLHYPGGMGIRIDGALYSGYTILPFYDAMIAKLIVSGQSRDHAIERAIRVLEEIDITGIKTNCDFLLDIVLSDDFMNHQYTTAFIETFLKGGDNHV